jgi:hypothetical protein
MADNARARSDIHSFTETNHPEHLEKLRLILKFKEKIETFLRVSESVERDNEEKLPPPSLTLTLG